MTLMNYRPSVAWARAPWDVMSRFQDEIDRLLDLRAGPFGNQHFTVWAPPLDVLEDKDNLVVKLEAPGMKKEGFEIALQDGVLSISGERKSEEQRQPSSGYRTERFEGRFQRSVTLPKSVQTDKVSASYKDGVLTIVLPIAEAAKPKQIVINAE